MRKSFIYSAFMIAFVIQVKGQTIIPLYEKNVPNSTVKLNENDQPTLEVYLPEKENKSETAVIIFPGGAYAFLAYAEEGTEIAKAFANKGITAFVVRYRLPKTSTMSVKSIGPLMDSQEAIKIIRSQSQKWQINPKKIGIVGFSAGGHLASTLGTHYKTNEIPNEENISLRPDFMILIYPVISMTDSLTHYGSKISLLGMNPKTELVDNFSNEKQVTKDTPPTYLTHCEDDGVVDVNNSIVFFQALRKNGVDAELHLFPKGNHGFIQRLPTQEWLDPILSFIKKEGF